jgi:hypothetical protein
MKSRLYFVLLLTTVFTVSAAGQKVAADAASTAPATREDILRLFKVMRLHEQMQTTMQLIMAQQQKMMRETIKQRVPEITDDQLAKIEATSKEAVKDLPLDGMLDDSIPVYQKHLTKGDVDAMSRFYSTPTGQKLLREQPAIAGESMQAMSPRMQKAMGEMMDRITRMAQDEAEKEKSPPAEKPEQHKN